MAKNLLDRPPEVFLSTSSISAQVSRAVAAGKARKICPRLYTTNMTDAPESIVKRNLWHIVGLLFPDTVVGHRTALEERPTPDGRVFLTGPYTRTITLPGLTVLTIKGPGPLAGDSQLVGGLWHASAARAFLENLKPSRKRSGPARTLPRKVLEDRLERLLLDSGDEAVKLLRDEAGTIAPALGADREYAQLRDMTATLLGTLKPPLSAPAANGEFKHKPLVSDAKLRSHRPRSVTPAFEVPGTLDRGPKRVGAAEPNRQGEDSKPIEALEVTGPALNVVTKTSAEASQAKPDLARDLEALRDELAQAREAVDRLRLSKMKMERRAVAAETALEEPTPLFRRLAGFLSSPQSSPQRITITASLDETTRQPLPVGRPTRFEITAPSVPKPGATVNATWRALDGDADSEPRGGPCWFQLSLDEIRATIVLAAPGNPAETPENLTLIGRKDPSEIHGTFSDRLFVLRSGVFVAKIQIQ